MNFKTVSLALSCSLLVACGGGNGSSSEAPEPTPAPGGLTGVFHDSPVKGLRYQTATHWGLTNALGEFRYAEGEQVTFYLGGTLLGVAQGAEIITPFSLFGITPLTSEAAITSALSNPTVNSFDRAINVATLLQTFDIDGNPENGIDLGNAHVALKNVALNLFLKATDFEHQTALASAKAAAKINISRSFGTAVKHLYQSLDLEVASSAVANFVSESNTGHVESISYQYNNDGRISAQSIDSNTDGVIDAVKSFSYDSRGNLSRTTNSATQTTETMTYNSNNQLLTRLVDQAQGSDILESYTYSNGKLSRFEVDLGADGSVEATTLYSYDGQGNQIGYQVDKDGDGVNDSVASYTFTDNIVTSYVEDNNNDGTPNFIVGYAYDDQGNRISLNVDLALDGHPNSVAAFEYDTHNNIVRYQLDRNLDGTPDYIEAYTYDGNNNRTQYRRDLDADGTWDVLAQYVYDADGRRTRMIEDSDGNGMVDKVWTGNYQAAVLDSSWDSILGKL